MTVKDTLRRSLLTYPLILKNALDVYEQWFCVIGNGYEWENGELVSINNDLNIKTKFGAVLYQIKEFFVGKYRWKFIRLSNFGRNVKRNIKKTNELINRVLNVDKNVNDFTPIVDEAIVKDISEYKFRLYPLCKYSKICTLPDDIKPDWLEAAKKMYEIMIKNPYIVEDEEMWLPKIAKRIKELYK